MKLLLASRLLAVLLGLVFTASGQALGVSSITPHAIVSSGHRGAVLDMAVDDARGLVFTVGEDGTLRIWDTGTQTLVRTIAVTRQRAQSVAVDPVAALAAVVVSDGGTSFSVDVWDWSAQKHLYRVVLESSPLFVRFSQTGTFLLYGDMKWDGLHVCRADDGTRLPFHPEGFGMVAFAESSLSDTTLMTYELLGRIEYWNIASGSVIHQAETVESLTNIQSTMDNRFLVGRSGSDIICIDALTGKVRYRLSVPGLVAMDVSTNADRVTWLTDGGSLGLWTELDNSLGTRPAAEQLGWLPVSVRFAHDSLLLAGSLGEMSMIDKTDRPREFAKDIIAEVSGFAVQDNMLAVAAAGIIRVFHVEADASAGGLLAELLSAPAPYPGPVGLEFLDAKRLIVWREGSEPGTMGVLDLSSRTFFDLEASFDNPLAGVTERDGLIYSLEKGGRISILDSVTGVIVFRATRPGAVCIAPYGPSIVFVGRARGGDLQSSLVRINWRTGETSAMGGSEVFTFALTPDPARGGWYSLGVDSDGRVKVFYREGQDPTTASIIDSSEEEYLGESIALDVAAGKLYSALAAKAVAVWNGTSLLRLGDPSPGIRMLQARAGMLFSLLCDSTISLWDVTKDRSVGDVYPFLDGSWAAILADGTVLGDPEGKARVQFFAQATLPRGDDITAFLSSSRAVAGALARPDHF
jgi:hypothetical protein